MICFASIMCVLNDWRLAPLKQNQKIGHERQPAFSSFKYQCKIWQLGYQNVQATFFKANRPPKNRLAQAPKQLFPACLKQWHARNTNPTNQTIADGALGVQILGAKSKQPKCRDHLFCVSSRYVMLFWLKTESKQTSQLLLANLSFVKHVCLTKQFVWQNGLFISGEIEIYMISINNINGR